MGTATQLHTSALCETLITASSASKRSSLTSISPEASSTILCSAASSGLAWSWVVSNFTCSTLAACTSRIKNKNPVNEQEHTNALHHPHTCTQLFYMWEKPCLQLQEASLATSKVILALDYARAHTPQCWPVTSWQLAICTLQWQLASKILVVFWLKVHTCFPNQYISHSFQNVAFRNKMATFFQLMVKRESIYGEHRETEVEKKARTCKGKRFAALRLLLMETSSISVTIPSFIKFSLFGIVYSPGLMHCNIHFSSVINWGTVYTCCKYRIIPLTSGGSWMDASVNVV